MITNRPNKIEKVIAHIYFLAVHEPQNLDLQTANIQVNSVRKSWS